MKGKKKEMDMMMMKPSRKKASKKVSKKAPAKKGKKDMMY